MGFKISLSLIASVWEMAKVLYECTPQVTTSAQRKNETRRERKWNQHVIWISSPWPRHLLTRHLISYSILHSPFILPLPQPFHLAQDRVPATIQARAIIFSGPIPHAFTHSSCYFILLKALGFNCCITQQFATPLTLHVHPFNPRGGSSRFGRNWTETQILFIQ